MSADEPTHWRPLYEWHNPSNLTDEEVGVKDGWRLCLKGERLKFGDEVSEKHEPFRRILADCVALNPVMYHDLTYRTRRPLPESAIEPKEGGETCAHKVSETPNVSSSTPLPNSESLRINPGASNAAAGTSNPFQYRRK